MQGILQIVLVMAPVEEPGGRGTWCSGTGRVGSQNQKLTAFLG